MREHRRNVVFLCTVNSARSIMAEAILGRTGGERFRAFSAGSHPKGEVHPIARALLRERRHDISGLSSKSWDVFAGPEAPAVDVVVTVCDAAAAEACPVWPGAPVATHWGLPDPAAATGDEAERRAAFEDAYPTLEARIESFVRLPLDELEGGALTERLDAIGRIGAAVETGFEIR